MRRNRKVGMECFDRVNWPLPTVPVVPDGSLPPSGTPYVIQTPTGDVPMLPGSGGSSLPVSICSALSNSGWLSDKGWGRVYNEDPSFVLPEEQVIQGPALIMLVGHFTNAIRAYEATSGLGYLNLIVDGEVVAQCATRVQDIAVEDQAFCRQRVVMYYLLSAKRKYTVGYGMSGIWTGDPYHYDEVTINDWDYDIYGYRDDPVQCTIGVCPLKVVDCIESRPADVSIEIWDYDIYVDTITDIEGPCLITLCGTADTAWRTYAQYMYGFYTSDWKTRYGYWTEDTAEFLHDDGSGYSWTEYTTTSPIVFTRFVPAGTTFNSLDLLCWADYGAVAFHDMVVTVLRVAK